jgi:predicted metal-dependent HD superfamily phosphohydrolase
LDYDLRLARDGAEAESTLASGLALAAVLRGLAVFGEAEVLLRWCYDALKRRHGDDDSLSLAAADQLGGLLAELGSTDEAITLRQQVLEVAERSLPPDDALALDLALDLALNLANTLAKAYRLNEAAKLYGTTFARLETLADCENESMKMSEWDGMGMPRSRSI